jgi:hypothetical protein
MVEGLCSPDNVEWREESPGRSSKQYDLDRRLNDSLVSMDSRAAGAASLLIADFDLQQ